jgi:membrane associated rhomboid family serine protease
MNYLRKIFTGVLPAVTKHIVIINGLIWLAQFVLLRIANIDLSQQLGLHYITSEKFRIYQIITYMFLHDPRFITHVFFNMFAVYMFGKTLEMVWGAKRFLAYYLITGIGAGLTQMLIIFLRMKLGVFPMMDSVTVGASGAVFGILLAFGMLFPNSRLYIIPLPFPIKAKWFVVGYGLLELLLGVINRTGDNVAHFAHLGGMLFGIFMILYWRKRNKTYGGFY